MTLTRFWLLNLAQVIGDEPATREQIIRLLDEPEFKQPEAHIEDLMQKHMRPAFRAMLEDYSRRLLAARQARLQRESEAPPETPKTRHKHRQAQPKALSTPSGGYKH